MLCQVYRGLHPHCIASRFTTSTPSVLRFTASDYLFTFPGLPYTPTLCHDICCMLPQRERERHLTDQRSDRLHSEGGRQGPLLYLALSQLFTFRLDSFSGCVSGHLFGCFRWLALTSRVLLDLGLFWDCDFVSCGLISGTTFRFCTACQPADTRHEPGEEGNARWPQGHPPSVLSKLEKKFFLYFASGAGRFGSFFSRRLPFYFLLYLKLG